MNLYLGGKQSVNNSWKLSFVPFLGSLAVELLGVWESEAGQKPSNGLGRKLNQYFGMVGKQLTLHILSSYMWYLFRHKLMRP